jgi:hypothetical protein
MPDPKVGIFWFHPFLLKVLCYSLPVSEVVTEIGFKTSSYDHCDMWSGFQEKYPEFGGMEY